jgi:hypothetical protein
MSFGEFGVVLLVAFVVIGPKELPRYLRMFGKFTGRARDWLGDIEGDPVLIAAAFTALMVAAVYLVTLSLHFGGR